jgi:hypothetical protein
MSDLRSLLSIVRDYMPELTEVRALEYINRAYKTLMQTDTRVNVYMNFDDPEFPYPIIKKTFTYSPDSGKAPEPTPRSFYFLDGEYGVFEDSQGNPITLSVNGVGVSVRRVNAIFTEVARYNDAYQIGYYNPLGTYYNQGYRGTKWYDRKFVRIPCNLYQKTSSVDNNASVQFNTENPYEGIENPIYVEFWYDPPAITNKAQSVLIDLNRWQDVLIDGAVGYYEDLKNGRSDRLDKFKRQGLREFKNEYNKNYNNKTNVSFPPREIG